MPDLDNWAKSWHGLKSDIPIGESLVEVFKPFLLELLTKGMSVRTFRRHRGHVWLLGGEIIRHRHFDSDMAKLAAKDAILDVVDELGGPISQHLFESEQEAFDATCRKLFAFLSQGSDG